MLVGKNDDVPTAHYEEVAHFFFVMEPVLKSAAQTESERYLGDLCSRSFLSLWSYPSIYRDQVGTGPEGKNKRTRRLPCPPSRKKSSRRKSTC